MPYNFLHFKHHFYLYINKQNLGLLTLSNAFSLFICQEIITTAICTSRSADCRQFSCYQFAKVSSVNVRSAVKKERKKEREKKRKENGSIEKNGPIAIFVYANI